ncbi:MAG: hypothetical protein HY721_18635 [Planctomycetes bacterium]|nr:hypothetical protein [Planctomycetota bacterium]
MTRPLTMAVLLAGALPGAAAGYTLRVTHPASEGGVLELEGLAGTPTGALDAAVELDLPAGSDAVFGWDLGLAHDSSVLTLEGATVAGTAADGAELVTVDAAPGGLVGSVVLAADHGRLLPAASTSLLLVATYHGAFPARDTTVQTRLRLVDGLQGPGGPVTTRVRTWDGAAEASSSPDKANLIVLLSGFELSRFFDLSLLVAGGVEVPEGQRLRGFVRPGEHPGFLVRTMLDSKLPPDATSGAQGWSLSIAHSSDAFSIAALTTEGTDAGRLISGGFERNELVDNASGRGLVSAIVLSFSKPISLPPQGRAEILRTTYRLTADTSRAGDRFGAQVAFRDNLQGQGQPVKNVVTHLGQSNRPLVRRTLVFDLEVGVPPRQPFIRSDSNGDGRRDIADAVWLVTELFFRGPETACFYTADANGDGLKDISDVAFVIGYQFLGGRAPPHPFPLCGALEEQDPILCPIGSTPCSG